MMKKKVVFMLYFLELGNSSQNDIWSIIPAIRENNSPRMVLLINLLRIRYAKIAPIGSLKADIKVYNRAFFLLSVA